jgi:hypothetical protein
VSLIERFGRTSSFPLFFDTKSALFLSASERHAPLRWIYCCLLVLPSFASAVWVPSDWRVAVVRQGGLLLEQRVTVTLRFFFAVQRWRPKAGRSICCLVAPRAARALHTPDFDDDSAPTAYLSCFFC